MFSANRLQRQFIVDQPNCAWLTDTTYIRTWQGWLYLAVVLNLLSLKLVGWSIPPTLARELVVAALMMKVWRREPKSPVIVHSVQLSQ